VAALSGARIAWTGAAVGAAAIAALAGCSTSWLDTQSRLGRAVERLEASAEAGDRPAPDLPKPPMPARTGEARMGLVEAIALALRHNQEVQVVGYDPLRAETDILTAEAVYDPSAFLQNNFARTDRPTQNTLDTGRVRDTALLEDRWAAKYGIRQRALTGGTLALYQDMD